MRQVLTRTLAWMLAVSVVGFGVSLLIDAPLIALTLTGIGTAWIGVLLLLERTRK